MGPSGTGKKSLLNVLANRTTTGVIRGGKYVDAKYQDDGFARKVGYAQQQDLHLSKSTVREALIFSARLRQSKMYSDEEKIEWVDDLIHTLDMPSFAEAIIGVPGEGLNAEKRKRVTMGVELAAKPELLLFLGQAILRTIHQPSGILFETFDRLLFLHEGISTYFGELGQSSRTLIDYFQRHGSRECGVDENPAEWLLEVVDNSAGLINGFSFYNSQTSIQGVQNQIFFTFLLLTLHGNLVQLTLPHLMDSRTLYEARECSSRTYSWMIFVLPNTIAELPGICFLTTIQFTTWYYPIGMYRYALTTRSPSSRGILMYLINVSFFLFSSTFSQMLGTTMPDPATGVNISALLYTLSLIFCGPSHLPPQILDLHVPQHPRHLPHLLAPLHRSLRHQHRLRAQRNPPHRPPSPLTCAQYLLTSAAHLLTPESLTVCDICPVGNTIMLLASVGVYYKHRWRDLAIALGYSGVNVGSALGLCWMVRVPRRVGMERKV
ncbi:hypothetical protein BHYA_0085g00030 [Botrytis hyacinthi]|uniref:ABC transporter domain-containing protein n=1 Tax=Botrytis hyacinthi TaxID=278943 RepID=A0A4Z1GXA7_9HELO|nr:hypothetical protein BHYA_0085g00030 [Botrytis hyacinthi]